MTAQVKLQLGSYIAQLGEPRAVLGYSTPYAVFKRMILNCTVKKAKLVKK